MQKRQYSQNSGQGVLDYDTIETLFGRSRQFENIRDDSRYIEFSQRLKSIQLFCENKHVDLGEALIMINKTFGWVWDTIPYCKLEEVKQWFENNWFRVHQILEPEKHAAILAMPGAQPGFYRDFHDSNGERRGPIAFYGIKHEAEKVAQHWSADL